MRFNPRYRMAKQAIDEGRIGKIVALSSRRNIPAAWTPTILNKIGPIVGDAIHDTDIMLWFTGDRVVSAYAQTVDVRGLKYPDIGQTMYRFAGGATATLETVWCMPEKTPFDIDERMSIIGTEGIIHVQDTFPNLGIVDGNKLHSPDTTYWPMFNGVRGGALRDEFSYFASLRARRQAGDHRHAGGRDRRAGSNTRRRGIGPHRQCREDWLMHEYVFDHVGITTTEPQPRGRLGRGQQALGDQPAQASRAYRVPALSRGQRRAGCGTRQSARRLPGEGACSHISKASRS